MVPRAFLFTSAMPARINSNHSDEKTTPKQLKIEVCPFKDPSRPKFDRALDQANEKIMTTEIHSSPVVIPPKRKRTPRTATSMTSHDSRTVRSRSRTPRNSSRLRRSSSAAALSTPVASILEATAIPVPRRHWTTVRESRRSCRGNDAEELSKFLADRDEHRFADGSSSSALDVLLSPPEFREETDKPPHDDDAESAFSLESAPSLAHDDLESPGSVILSSPSPSQRSLSERRHRHLVTPEDCAYDHPLLQKNQLENLESATPSGGDGKDGDSSTRRRPSSRPRLRATFKSNLTASLRAIKSAAHTVSTFASPSVQPEDFLTRSLFTIAPELTDDRRPPPMSEPPSPALRRYLNPTPISPAEMHIYHEENPRDPTGTSSSKCPVSIQMQTYRRSDGHGAKKKGSRGSQGFSPVDPEIVPVTSRQREPRENSNFLRVVVLEMNMRRIGKLRDDIPIRTRFCLPPRKGNASVPSNGDYADEDGSAVPRRWIGVSADE